MFASGAKLLHTAAKSLFGADLMLSRCLFLQMFAFGAKLLHYLFEAYSMLVLLILSFGGKLLQPHTNVCARGQFEGVALPKSI